jgi:hypothetical protein
VGEVSLGSAEETLPQAEAEAVAMQKYYAGLPPYHLPPPPPPVAVPSPSPPPDQNNIRVETRVDVEYPPQVQYIWDTSRISGQEYQQHYGYVSPVVGGPYTGQYLAVQGPDGRVYWVQSSPVSPVSPM